MEQSLEETKAPVRCELGVACKHKANSCGVVQAHQGPPAQILEHNIVFILPTAIVCMQMQVLLPNTLMFHEMVQVAHYNIATFPTGHRLVD